MASFKLSPLIVENFVRSALLEDLNGGIDVTSSYIVKPETQITGQIVSRSRGVIAGLEFCKQAFLITNSDLKVEPLLIDGDTAEKGQAIFRVNGCARSILTAERTALNFLSHLSGIATATRQLVDIVSETNVRICCTRKTTPLIRSAEKFAVICGGGYNHRFGLNDAVLVKDNHLVAAAGVVEAVKSLRAKISHVLKIEVEVDQIEQIEPIVTAGADIIMLDNMSPVMMKDAVALINGRALVEASGSINKDNILAVAESGVDVISVGWITHSAPSIDIGLDF
tara:strand:+ start:431 stop:1276 length:846 start_codon:yes stop_codon:yes gene_type:complete